MKKIIILFAALLTLFGCTEDRSQILKVYNWADYIDEQLLEEFEVWYEQETGEKVRIIYQTYDINETMLSQIEIGHEDYDVVCPSDYIIERMLRNDLLKPLNKDFGSTPNYIDPKDTTCVIAPYIIEQFNNIDGNGKNANDYSVGYMWGTVGVIYNTKHVNTEDVNSWQVFKNPRYHGKILIKDAFRDVYTALWVGLNNGSKDLNTLTKETTSESIASVESFMNGFKDAVAGWEADFGKEQMTKELAWLNLSWSGDAQWAIEEAAEMGVTLDYTIPQEGSVVWFDGWVIPKYAKNEKAARYFINFMCMPENALRNMDVTGYVSVVGGNDVLEAMSDSTYTEPIDVSYFFGDTAKCVQINPIMYPPKSTIEKCAIMHDAGTEDLLKMWSRVKGANATIWTYILIIIVLAGLITLVILRYIRKSYRKKMYSKKRRKIATKAK